MSQDSTASLAFAPASSRPRHIIDVLIEERAPTLAAQWYWPALRPALLRLLDYRKAVRMADTIAPLPGADALEFIARLLDMRLTIEGLEHVPPSGKCVIVANHPTGIADGIALYDAVKARRPDICFYANADAHRVCPGFHDVLIPVEWVQDKRTREKTRETLRRSQEAFDQGRPIMIFPAGRLARRIDGVIQDPEWMASAVSIARKNECMVIPCHMSGPHATLFHFFDQFSKELRDITLFHELLNKHGGAYRLQFGAPIAPEKLEGDATAVTERLKAFVERDLAHDPRAAFGE
jgi:putative hemolysin